MADVPKLGARGGGWVVLQFALIAAILALGLLAPGWPDGASWWLKGAAALLALLGAVVAAGAARALGSGLTPFPRPPPGGEIVESGPYAVVRHPIYSGGILLFAGISLALSPWALAGTAALAVLWGMKARVEERFLLAHDPAYAAYCRRTRYRLVPFLY